LAVVALLVRDSAEYESDAGTVTDEEFDVTLTL
jgi:hypothetical protein